MSFSASSSTSVEINVTPLIDVLLVLLIIFMVIAPTLPRGIESSIPKPDKGAVSTQQPVSVRILASATGGLPLYRIGEKTIPFADLKPQLQQAFSTRAFADRTLFVEADRALSYQRVVEVAGLGRAAGANAVALLDGRQPR